MASLLRGCMSRTHAHLLSHTHMVTSLSTTLGQAYVIESSCQDRQDGRIQCITVTHLFSVQIQYVVSQDNVYSKYSIF